MAEITQASNGHCFDHGISVMRLALGYKRGLPDGWPFDLAKTVKIIFQLTGLAFPDRPVLIWGSKPRYKLPKNVQYQGNEVIIKNTDKYLWGFSYSENSDGPGHWVIGEPIWCGLNHILCVVAVSI